MPGVVTNNVAGVEKRAGERVHRQRAASELQQLTIERLSNIETGDNGGNMATTNIDAVAEFKILTNAYQADTAARPAARNPGGPRRVGTQPSTAPLLVRPPLGHGTRTAG